jgi:activator of HSP90 ATPase
MPIAPTRRQAILFLGAAGITSLHGTADTPKSGTKIHQEVDFQVPPSRIYEVLLNSNQFSKVTGHPAEIHPQAGGSLKMFGGLIEGRNIELDPNRRIVQAWREASWLAGYYTLVKFELLALDSGTHLVFDQTGIAEPDWGHLNEGWPIRYWEPLRKYFKS